MELSVLETKLKTALGLAESAAHEEIVAAVTTLQAESAKLAGSRAHQDRVNKLVAACNMSATAAAETIGLHDAEAKRQQAEAEAKTQAKAPPAPTPQPAPAPEPEEPAAPTKSKKKF